ncbi:MAG: DUF4239 domain-containing protein [Vicinamibacteria bacterium]
MGDLTIINPAVVGGSAALILFVGILASLRAGRRIGLRAIERAGGAPNASIGSLEAAVFALLGLMIAFTFSGALTRFDVRRAQAVDEANAIGTAWLRVDLLPAQAQPALGDTFRRYVDSRIATYRALPDIATAEREVDRSQALQAEIWKQAVAAPRISGVPTSGEILFMPALYEMFDISATRVAATRIHPPTIIYLMLIALALVAALLAGYQSAGEKGYDWVHKVGFATIVAATVYVILDIEFPRLGFVRLDAIDQLLVNVRAGMT